MPYAKDITTGAMEYAMGTADAVKEIAEEGVHYAKDIILRA